MKAIATIWMAASLIPLGGAGYKVKQVLSPTIPMVQSTSCECIVLIGDWCTTLGGMVCAPPPKKVVAPSTPQPCPVPKTTCDPSDQSCPA